MADYRISVEKDNLSFSAAHFLVFNRKCERLHGHNYSIAVEIEGELDDKGYVFDFVELKTVAAQICDSLDHRVLLPSKNVALSMERENDEVLIEFGSKRYLLPGEDVLILPVENVTAELLASHICQQMAEHLGAGIENLASITVRVDESPGQSAFFRKNLR